MKILLALIILLGAGAGYGIYSGMIPGKDQILALMPAHEEKAQEENAVQSESERDSVASVYDVLQSNPEYSSFLEAAGEAGFDETLKGEGPITVFVPNNAAFENAAGVFDQVLSNENFKREVLAAHIIPGVILDSYIGDDGIRVAASNGRPVLLEKSGDGIIYNDVETIQTNIPAKNGVIHVIDRLTLMPVTTPPAGAQTPIPSAPAPSETDPTEDNGMQEAP